MPLSVHTTTHPLAYRIEANLTKPVDQSVFGLVFYGRADRVRILNCYLERNLVEQGGWLDEVHFVRNTENATDLAYLDELLRKHSRYKIIDINSTLASEVNDRYKAAWRQLQRDTIYVKIDDDVVWLADDAIPRMVSRKFNQDDYLVVSASVINSPLMSKVHLDAGAYHPYLPAHATSTPKKVLARLTKGKASGRTSWQYNQYPIWEGPSNYTLHDDDSSNSSFPVWLRLPEENLNKTPAQGIEYNSWGSSWSSWRIAAQSHLSLLENLYHGNTSLYFSNLDEEVWFTQPDRLSVNVIAIFSNDILDNMPDDAFDDEEWLTVTLPGQQGKRVGVETRALAAHFAFGAQSQVESTDILARYQDRARQMACLKI
ncbi:hypothetical protein LTR64_006101 [Lithohypha guttulata]|uniref:uncharacterized protein n=1 Tax=Lithohypha guttulata TaxID=1690604 RepID=UPI002DDE0C02|nr:hypothetical protein LTR51_002101 [Lithohypha guttulata]